MLGTFLVSGLTFSVPNGRGARLRAARPDPRCVDPAASLFVLILFGALIALPCGAETPSFRADPVRPWGVGLALGGGPGIGFTGFYNLRDKLQIRSGLGLDVTFSDGNRKKQAGGDTLDAYADDVEFTLQGRYYLLPNLYVGNGITYCLRYLKAEKEIEHADSLESVDLSLAYKVTPQGTAVFLAHAWTGALALPLKIGVEFGRRSGLCGYAEAGYLWQVIPWEQTVVLPVKTGAVDYPAKYASGRGHYLLGIGFTLNMR